MLFLSDPTGCTGASSLLDLMDPYEFTSPFTLCGVIRPAGQCSRVDMVMVVCVCV